jgi:hypothetical protein
LSKWPRKKGPWSVFPARKGFNAAAVNNVFVRLAPEVSFLTRVKHLKDFLQIVIDRQNVETFLLWKHDARLLHV